MDFSSEQKLQFLYINVFFNDRKVAALLDSGSSINIMSKTLFDSIHEQHKLSFERLQCSEIRLANNETIRVSGVATIELDIEAQGAHCIDVYILPVTSHPLILGTDYLKKNKVLLDFGKMSCNLNSTNVQTHRRLNLDPNSETIVWARVPNYVTIGLQGVCSKSKFSCGKGLLVAKSVVTVPNNRKVPVKLLNPTNETIVIPKGRTVAEFNVLNNEYDCTSFSNSLPTVQHARLSETNTVENFTDFEKSENVHSEHPCKEPDFSKVKTLFKMPDSLEETERDKLVELLHENLDLFVTDDNPDLGFTRVVEHKILLKPDVVGKHQKPYRLPPYKRDILRDHLDHLLEQGIIAPVSETEDLLISSPIVLVSKRSKNSGKPTAQDFRFCCDFRFLNSQTREFKYTIPDLQELTESFSEIIPNFISSIDLSSGFFQMGLSSDSSQYTSFNTCFGTYRFLRLPMGLKTAPNTFQLLMDKVLHGLKFKSCLCYLDDVLICSETFEQHMSDLKEVFMRFRNAGLKLGPKKCSFAAQSCIFLGHQISKDGIRPPPDRVKAITEFPCPKNVKELRRILGLFNWFRKFISNYSALVHPLTRLLKKGQPFKWQIEQETAFNDLKQKLTNSKILSFPRYDLTFRLSVDTSSRGIGYMLYQFHANDNTQQPRIIRFGSKSLSPWQQSYGPTKLELLGMVVSILDCADYLRGNSFIVECDHQALKPLYQKQFKGAIYERWMSILQQFTFQIVYKKAEDMQVPDALSRCENVKADVVESPDEDDPYFPYIPDKVGQVILPDGQNFSDLINSKLPDVQAVHLNDLTLVSEKSDPYDADTDEKGSDISDRKKKRKPRLRSISERTKDIDNESQVEQTLNNSVFRSLSISAKKMKELQGQDNILLKIIDYLENDNLPQLQKEARRILLQSADYAVIDGILFHSRVARNRRNKMMGHYQIVVPDALIDTVLNVVHDSPLGGHSGINNTLDRAKEHFFFPRMGKIVTDYVQSCHFCQIRKVSNKKTKQSIVSFPTPAEPFQVWQIDLCGPYPVSPNGNSYVFTAVDMFSKFMFAFPLRNKDAATICEALYHMFTTYGVCQTLISDRVGAVNLPTNVHLKCVNCSKLLRSLRRHLHTTA